MSLDAFPHPNERHATPPPTKTAFPSTWECCFGRKTPGKQRTKRCFWKKSTKKRLFCDVSFLKPLKKCVGSMVSFPSHPYRPSEWATNFENNPYRPSERAYFSENTFADGSEAGFSRKTTKTIPAFRLRFIPARHATKSRLPGNAFHNSLPLHKRVIAV